MPADGMSEEGEVSPDAMLPPVESLPAIAGVAECKRLLAEDEALALEMLGQCSEEELANKKVAPPWAPDHAMALGYYLLQMVTHLASHKAQLFYYLKLQGLGVDTGDLWG
jgi:hypothetical protein